jgi:hypothetical protein
MPNNSAIRQRKNEAGNETFRKSDNSNRADTRLREIKIDINAPRVTFTPAGESLTRRTCRRHRRGSDATDESQRQAHYSSGSPRFNTLPEKSIICGAIHRGMFRDKPANQTYYIQDRWPITAITRHVAVG